MNQPHNDINQVPELLRKAAHTLWRNGGLQWDSDLRAMADRIEEAIANASGYLTDYQRHLAARAAHEDARIAQKASDEAVRDLMRAISVPEPAPLLEEITIEAPAETLMQRAERILGGKNWTTSAELIDVATDLYARVLEMEADARIKAANANPGEPVEFKGLNGETIVARMVR